jgi:myotubularin-related protein 3/4
MVEIMRLSYICDFLLADQLYKEFSRLGYRASSAWKMTSVNNDYKLCKTYPKVHIVPKAITDKDLEDSAKFRSSGRFPSIVWRHQGNGVVLARCSQPLLGWFSWRSSQDEKMLKAISEACSLDQKHILLQKQSPKKTYESAKDNKAPQLLIVDARSYSAAVANRTKGGGCECKGAFYCLSLSLDKQTNEGRQADSC